MFNQLPVSLDIFFTFRHGNILDIIMRGSVATFSKKTGCYEQCEPTELSSHSTGEVYTSLEKLMRVQVPFGGVVPPVAVFGS